jgi:preprotein translocase subunit SecG
MTRILVVCVVAFTLVVHFVIVQREDSWRSHGGSSGSGWSGTSGGHK